MYKSYLRYSIPFTSDEEKDILIATLSDWGIEGFEEIETTLIASGPENDLDTSLLENYLEANKFKFSRATMADQNWNAVWESSFQPVLIDDFVGVRASFHPAIKDVTHEIVITPKMSFGTGHHATTFLVMKMMEELEFQGKTVFDFGTGTGILAILAEKLGARNVIAVDNDDWCIENAAENILQNDCQRISILKSARPPQTEQFNIFLANINKHIIVANFENILEAVREHGAVLLSGLLNEDLNDISEVMAKYDQTIIKTAEKDGWIAIFFRKSSF